MNTRRINVGDMQGRLSEESLEATQEAARGLLASPWLYFGGIVSLCIWAVAIKVFA